MPIHESEELRAIRMTAEMVTEWRAGAADREHMAIIVDIRDLRVIEAQLWTAYALACEREPNAAGGE